MEDITRIILENENLIYSIASKFSKYKNKEDLFQVGCIGMIEAYKNFDESRGVKFTSYAYRYIYGQMSKFAREDHTIKLSKEANSLKGKLELARGYLTQKYMRYPTSRELAEYLEIEEEVVDKLLNYSDPYSMDEVTSSDLSMHEIIESKSADYDSLIFLKNEIENLSEPERSIMISRYYEDLTQSEVASNLGLSQVDVSRKERKVLTKLKKILN